MLVGPYLHELFFRDPAKSQPSGLFCSSSSRGVAQVRNIRQSRGGASAAVLYLHALQMGSLNQWIFPGMACVQLI